MTISVFLNRVKTKRSLSPVMRWEAPPSAASAKRKSSLLSRQMVTTDLGRIKIAFFCKRKIRLSKTIEEKYFLNFCRCATLLNSSNSSSLKRIVICCCENKWSSLLWSLVSKKLIQILVSIITLYFDFFRHIF